MKKTIITLFALSGVAAAEPFLPDLLNQDKSLNIDWLTYTAGLNGLTGNDSSKLTEADVTDFFKKATNLTASGWHAQIGGAQNGGDPYGVGKESIAESEVYVSAEDAFSFHGRQAYGGEIVACSVSASSLISEKDVVSSLTLGFSTEATTNKIVFTLWAWDGKNATSLMGGATVNSETLDNDALAYEFSGNTKSNTISIAGLSLDKDDTIIAVWGASSAGTVYTVSGLTSTYTTAPIPEPATATLSLLALAGLAARRRRK